MNVSIPKNEMFDILFNSYNYGNLGMFIGAGFSKAVMGTDGQSALGWLELLEVASENLELDFPKNKELIGVSLSELATLLCKQLAIEKSIDYEKAKFHFKNEICNLTNWLPSEGQTKNYREILDIIDPSWIITTNYDMVLETLLTGKSRSLGPTSYLSAPENITPIYHLHGTRLDPSSIILTQDDYIPLFRPNEYRQIKLSLTIRESTTLILGYGLGDTNVLSSVDWSKNIFTIDNEIPYEIIQVLWTESPKEDGYRDENENIIIEVNDLEDFLNELVIYFVKRQGELDTELASLKQDINLLQSGDEGYIQKFINKETFRKLLLRKLSSFESYMIIPYIQFLTLVINKVWKEASKDGAFYAYDKYLKILLDIVIEYEYNKMPPKLFQLTAQSLNKVLLYVSENLSTMYIGESWDATRTWHNRKKKNTG